MLSIVVNVQVTVSHSQFSLIFEGKARIPLLEKSVAVKGSLKRLNIRQRCKSMTMAGTLAYNKGIANSLHAIQLIFYSN